MKLPSRYITPVVILFNTVVLLLICEWAVRIFLQPNQTFEERSSFIINYNPSAYSKFHPKPGQKICAYINGHINYDSVKFRINSAGYRGDEIPLQKDSDEIRIAIIGGSHVFDPNCFDFEGAPGFPQLLQDNLRKRGFNARVINAGVPGSCTKEHLMRTFFDLSRYHPDYVVVNSIWNDIKWIIPHSGQIQFISEPPRAAEKNPLAEKVNLVDELLGWSVIYRKIHDYYWNRKFGFIGSPEKLSEGLVKNTAAKDASVPQKNFEEGYNQYRANMQLLINMIRQFNSTPVLAVEESLIRADNTDEEKSMIKYNYTGVSSHEELVAINKRCGTIITELAHTNGLKLIDAGNEMKDRKYFSDHVHMSPEGSRKTAEFYADFFQSELKK